MLERKKKYNTFYLVKNKKIKSKIIEEKELIPYF